VVTFLLFRSLLGSCFVAAVAAPNTIECSVRLNFVSHKPAARAANSDRDVVALLDSHAVTVIAPDKVIEIAGGLDCDLYFISRAGGILAGTIVLAFQARAAGARGGFGSALICSPVTPFAVERTIVFDVVIDDAAAFAVGAAGKRHGDHISVNDADAIGLIARAPTKLIDVTVRDHALRHARDSVAIARRLNSRDIVLWFADGSNYPGTANIRQRKLWFEESLRALHDDVAPHQRLLVEYKPFEPAFYHTDIADWGMALAFARAAGPRARVLVDTGHHYQSQNIEQIVAWLLSEGMLGGFHFNDRKYADDDLTLGSIDPYQVFRIFHEILFFEWESGARADIAYMIDQSHNLKGKIEAMIQTVVHAQELYAKAALVNYAALASAQARCQLVDAESVLRDAFSTDVRPAIEDWRAKKRLPADPLDAFRQSGYVERITAERGGRSSVTSSYA